MKEMQEKWEEIHHRFRMLDYADEKEEATLLKEAYNKCAIHPTHLCVGWIAQSNRHSHIFHL